MHQLKVSSPPSQEPKVIALVARAPKGQGLCFYFSRRADALAAAKRLEVAGLPGVSWQLGKEGGLLPSGGT